VHGGTMLTGQSDTVIIGAGPAGLALGASLRRKHVPFVMLERNGRVGSSWAGHYDRLHLHTPKGLSSLPYRPYPADYPRYPSRDQVLRYLEGYAREFDLRPEFGEEVRDCSHDGAGWKIVTTVGVRHARFVIVASGFNRTPTVPAWPGQSSFPGPILHSRDYVNGVGFAGQRVLVVGFGNSGAEIALDLAESGAVPAIAVRGGVNVTPRDVLGLPVTLIALASRHLPPRVADATNALTIRLAVGNLADVGLTKHRDGPFVQIAQRRRVPVIDVGTLAAIRRGAIGVRAGIASFDGSEIVFADGKRERFDAVVLATGFTPGLAAIFRAHPAVLNVDGNPTAYGREASVPGLYFCGFNVVPTGLLREAGIEARAIASDIARKRETRVSA
jgi:indole-3-pyruvate monooxygenase